MADETQDPKEPGPLPHSREAVDWWLKKWGRTEPLTHRDLDRLIWVNGHKAQDLQLNRRDMREIVLNADIDPELHIHPFNLQGARLQHANLQNSKLQGVNIQGADLSRANLQGADLREADYWLEDFSLDGFQPADLRCGANLQEATLVNADLRGASLLGANLQGADLRWVSMSSDTDLEGVKWDKGYINVLERRGNYEAASTVYRRLKEWYRGAGMLTIAGEFHYREREASRKAGWQRLGRQFKEQMAAAWRQLKGGDIAAKPDE